MSAKTLVNKSPEMPVLTDGEDQCCQASRRDDQRSCRGVAHSIDLRQRSCSRLVVHPRVTELRQLLLAQFSDAVSEAGPSRYLA